MRVGDGSASAALSALRLCSDTRGCLMGALFCFRGEGRLPRDPVLFIYFYSLPCMLGRERSEA